MLNGVKNKKVFNLNSIDLTKFASSLGLALKPRLRFMEKMSKNNPEELTEKENENDLFDVQEGSIVNLSGLEEIKKDIDKGETTKKPNLKKLGDKILKGKAATSGQKKNFQSDNSDDSDDEDEEGEQDFDIMDAKKRLQVADESDKVLEKEEKKRKRLEKKIKEKKQVNFEISYVKKGNCLVHGLR